MRLSAPMVPTTHTLAEGKRAFADLFELIPDVTAEVHRWGASAVQAQSSRPTWRRIETESE